MEDIDIKWEIYFDDEMQHFTFYLESPQTLEVDDLADAMIEFARQVRSGEALMFDPTDEVVQH